MASESSVIARARRGVRYAVSRLRHGPEADKASAYWASLSPVDYRLTDDPIAIERSRWLAEMIIPPLQLTSLLEIGTNGGRNLRYIHRSHPDMRLKGIDVNARAIEHAKSAKPAVIFEVADANRWGEPVDSWDSALTMSVLDHIPNDAVEALAENIAGSCRHVIAVELWDGSEGERGVYKYSRDTRSLFERHGFRTLRWEKAPGQYDEQKSLLWGYVGRRD